MKTGFATPFDAQLAFFRAKLNLPSERWDDIMREAHDKAFIVAGAMQADLLADLRQAVDQSIAGKLTLDGFRKEFADIVAKHGWTGWAGEGSDAGIAWRTRVIYQTNMATSYAAGRWAQLTDPALLAQRPYWRYRHLDGQLHPRPLHESWDGLVLHWTDPFWLTHFPPNGWGCHCWVEAVDEATYQEALAKGKGTAPEGWQEIDPKTGAQVGIDRGFDYAPGANAQRPLVDFLEEKIIRLDGPLGAEMWKALEPTVTEERAAAFRDWANGVIESGQAKNDVHVVGALSPQVVDFLDGQQMTPETAAITLRDVELLHLMRDAKQVRGVHLPEADLMHLPELMEAPAAVLFDTEDPALLYVFDPDTSGLVGKIVVRVNFVVKVKQAGQRSKMVTNSIRTAGMVKSDNLQESRYVLVDGEI